MVICAFIFLGGVQRLASVTEKLVPAMAAIFLVGAIAVLVVRIQHIPETFGLIFKYAFQPQAIIGGGFGAALKTAISQGAKRGSSPMRRAWAPPPTPTPRPTSRRPMSRAWWR